MSSLLAPSALASMAAALTAEMPRTPASAAAELHQVVGILRAEGSPAALRHADALDAWLFEGGDLQSLLGLRGRRGVRPGAADRKARLAARDRCLRRLAEWLPDDSLQAKAKIIAAAVAGDMIEVLAIRANTAPLPTSPKQIVRILRTAPTD